MRLKSNYFFSLISCLFFAALSSCGVYSFTGSNIDPNIKTISIQTFYDDSGLGPASLSQNFTDDLRDYFQSNTSLTQVRNSGDLQLEGSIVGYRFKPMAAGASTINNPNAGRSQMERLEIRIKVNFVNTQDESQNFSKTFTQYLDYNTEKQEQASAEPELIESITEQLVLDIFNSSVANW